MIITTTLLLRRFFDLLTAMFCSFRCGKSVTQGVAEVAPFVIGSNVGKINKGVDGKGYA